MTASTTWQQAFLAMSLSLGESLESALEALGDEAAHVTKLAAALRVESREKRARALADQLAPIAADLESLELQWRA